MNESVKVRLDCLAISGRRQGLPRNLGGVGKEINRLPGNGDTMKAVYKFAAPYLADKMNLPVENVEAAIPFYETVMGFRVLSRNDTPHKSAALGRDDIQIGLAENGGDPSQEGCFFEVDDAEAAFAELKANGLNKEEAGFRIDRHGDKSFKVFFVIAPDGLCYCLGERQK
jgi:catechol 2,3-dioxygenase-like lactoylglutathione lyase family enzyme